jgi:predicted nucleotidyltransferase
MTGTDNLPLNLPLKLRRSLRQVAQKYHRLGLDLFVFGSFARGNPRPNSDLDLGVTWRGQPDPRLFTQLYWELQAMPTIRKIDLVDFARAAPGFTRVALAHTIRLNNLEVLPDET